LKSFQLLKKWLALVIITLLLTLVVRPSAIAATPRSYTDLQFPPLKEVQLPNYERYQLDNGLVVYLVEDHDLPLVSGTALINTGSRLEPSEKVGLAEITGMVMRTGGTASHSPDQLNEILEQRAATVETSIGITSGNASFSSLSEDLPTVFSLFAEVLRHPAFTADQVDLAKTQLEGSIARRNDDPGDIADREFDKLIYGNDSPYGRTVEYATLAHIQRQDLIDFYQSYFYPNHLILGIVGDFDSQKMKSLIKKEFANWQPCDSATPTIPIVTPIENQKKAGGLFVVDQPQLTQSNILVGNLDGLLNNPDYPALSVTNGVMNGFGGRLFNELRSRQGLAYSVYGVWQPNFDYPGIFMAGGQTRSEATVPFIKSLQEEFSKLRTIPIRPDELTYAKESILNSFVFNFQKPGQTLSRLMRYEYFGYPKDFIFQYQKQVKSTTIADVQRVAQTYLHPEKMVTLVVGNNQEIKPPLSSLGKQLQMIDVTIPNPS
jgi:zinc protease